MDAIFLVVEEVAPPGAGLGAAVRREPRRLVPEEAAVVERALRAAHEDARLAAVVEQAPDETQLGPVIFRDDAGDRRRAHVAADHDEPRALDLARRAIADKRRAVDV